MEPFVVYCTTCHARLKVRKAKAIGTIVACPKCNAMVQVERPTVDEAPPPRRSPSSSSTSMNVLGVEADRQFEHVGDMFADDDLTDARINETDESALAGIAGASSVESFDDAAKAATHIEPELPPVNSGEAWGNSTVLRWKPWILAGGAGLLGICGAVGGFRLMIGSPSGASTQDRVVVPQPHVTDAEDSKLLPTAVAETRESVANVGDENMNVAAVEVPPARSDSPEPVVESRLADSVAVDVQRAAVTPAEDVIMPVDNAAAGNAAVDNSDDQFGELIGPVDLVPSGETEKDLARRDVADMEVPRPEVDPRNVAASEPEPNARLENSRSSVFAVVENAKHKPIDVDKRFAQRIPSIELTDIPLVQFVDFISDYSGVPISLRWESITHARASLQRTVSVDSQDATIGETVARALTPLRLAATQKGSIVEVGKQKSTELRTTRYVVSDLIDEDTTADHLLELIQKLVTPGGWKHQGGVGQIAVTKDLQIAVRHEERSHFETIVLLEQLRVVRGKKRMRPYPSELFTKNNRSELAREVLTRPVRVSSTGSRVSLSDFIRQVSAASGCLLVPDWQAFADEGWHLDTMLEVESAEVEFEEMLRQFESVLGLTYRVLDSRTIELTSRDQELRRTELCWYDLTPLEQAGAVLSKLEDEIGEAVGIDVFRLAGGVVVVESVSNHVVVRLPQSLQHIVSETMEFLTLGQ